MTREEGSPPRSFWSPTLATKGGKAGGKGDVIRRPSGAFYSWGFKVHPFLLQEPNFNNQSQGVKEKETRRANPPPWNKSRCVQKEALKLCIAEVRASSTTAWVGAGKKEKKWKGRRKGRNKKKRKGLGKMIRRDERGKKTIFLHTHARQKGASYGPPIFKIHRLLEVAGDCEDAQIFFFFFEQYCVSLFLWSIFNLHAVVVQSPIWVWLFATAWTAAYQAFPVPHHLPEFDQVHVPCISNAIQPSHPLMSSSPSALNLSQNQGLFQWKVNPQNQPLILEMRTLMLSQKGEVTHPRTHSQ